VNMSFGTSETPEATTAIRALLDAGVVLVASSGGTGVEGLEYPAIVPGVISVGAVTAGDAWQSPRKLDGTVIGSNYAERLDLVAPGKAILTTQPGPSPDKLYGFPTGTNEKGEVEAVYGTSPAAAQVSGVAVVLLAQNQDWAPETVRTRLIQTADKIEPRSSDGSVLGTYDAAGHEDHVGYGRLNAYLALGGIGRALDPTNTGKAHSATVYLCGSWSELASPVGTENSVKKHRSTLRNGTKATFSVSCYTPSGVEVISASVVIVSVTDKTVATGNAVLSPNASTGGWVCWKVAGVSINPGGLMVEQVFEPEIVFLTRHMDNGNAIYTHTRIPCPAVTLPAYPIRERRRMDIPGYWS